jgi:hypothetical protein
MKKSANFRSRVSTACWTSSMLKINKFLMECLPQYSLLSNIFQRHTCMRFVPFFRFLPISRNFIKNYCSKEF